MSDEASTFSDISITSITGAIDENAPPPSAFKYSAFTGAECTVTTATGASSSSTSMPEDQPNPTTLSIGDNSIQSEGKSNIFHFTQFQYQVIRTKIKCMMLIVNLFSEPGGKPLIEHIKTHTRTASAPGSRHPSGPNAFAPKSWLVLETVEPPLNSTRHYLMPSQIQKRWRKRDWSSQKLKGTRLHIFMDHVFVSKRIKG